MRVAVLNNVTGERRVATRLPGGGVVVTRGSVFGR
jgi:hypothetical protein